MTRSLEIVAVEGIPEIAEGASLGTLIAERVELRAGDIVVLSQKVVSKAEGRLRRLSDVEPGSGATALASQLGKDPALVQLVFDESRSIVRAEGSVLISETQSGLICANAGIDSSNVAEEGTVTLLPRDPDASARRIRDELGDARPAVVIADSFGRPWRLGQVDVAIGIAGLAPLDDWRGRFDRGGRELQSTAIAIADEVAGAADLVRDKTSGLPAVVVRGLGQHVCAEDGPGAVALQRARGDDLFR